MGSMDLLTRTEWESALKRRLSTSNFELLKIKVRPLGTDGAGFLGDHCLAEVSVRLNDSSRSPKILHFFFKTLPQGREDQRTMCEASGSFQKEADALGGLFVDLRSALIDQGRSMKWTCEYYYVRPDLILLEDLYSEGFTLADAREPLGYQHCAAVMKALANLHAASLIFEETRETQPFRIGSEYVDTMKESFFRHDPENPDHPGTPWLNAAVTSVLSLLEEIHGKDQLGKMKDDLQTAFHLFYELEKPSERFRNVVSHGDLWGNNIFFRLLGGEPVEASLVDFQLLRYVPPASDIMSFLHLTTTRTLRAQYETQLLALYHGHITQNIKQHGLDPEYLLSWETFKESCDFYKTLGIIKASCYCTIVLFKKEDVQSAFASSKTFKNFFIGDRRKEVLRFYTNDVILKKRIDGILEELIEECVIRKRHRI